MAWSLPWPRQRRRSRRTRDISEGARYPRRRNYGAAETVLTCSARRPSSSYTSSMILSFIGVLALAGASVGSSPLIAEASPFDPRPPPKSERQPFFEGWFIRVVDHEQRLSFAVIIGSIKAVGTEGPDFDQHYVAISYLHDPVNELPIKSGTPADGIDNADGSLASEETESSDDNGCDKGHDGGQSVMRRGSDSLSPFFSIPKKIKNWVMGVDRGSAGEKADDPNEEPSHGVDGDLTLDEDKGDDFVDAHDTGHVEGEKHSDGYHDVEYRLHSLRGLYAGDNSESYASVEDSQDISQGDEENDGLQSYRDDDDSMYGAEGLHQDQHHLSDSSLAPEFENGQSEEDMEGVGGTNNDGSHEHLQTNPVDRYDATDSRPREPAARREQQQQQQQPPPPPPPREQWRARNSNENAGERTYTYHAFPSPETVTISCRGEPVTRAPNLVDDPNFTWEADGVGSFMVDGDSGRLSFQLPEISVAASFRHRLPWSARFPNSAGPEGWLQRTGLLPLHYFVYSMGSEAGYSMKVANASQAIVGRGSMHLEANYGESFPTGWIWAQGCSATEGLTRGTLYRGGVAIQPGSSDAGGRERKEGEVDADVADEDGAAPPRFVLTGGRFKIGPVTTNSFVLAYRSPQHHWNFRTTDLDRISVTASRNESRVTLVARSWHDERVLEADITAPEGSFGSHIFIPTEDGFSNSPGCVESYAATASFRLYTKSSGRDDPLLLQEEAYIDLSALEFGGDYQDT